MKPEKQKKDHKIAYMFVDTGHYGNTFNTHFKTREKKNW